jgi:hypothetical protein
MSAVRVNLIVFLFLTFFIYINSIFAAETVATSPKDEKVAEPFAFGDFTWLNGNSRQKTPVFDSKYFTGEFTFDANYIYDFNHPKDHTIVGSTNTGRSNEFQVEQLGVGGDFHYENIRGRLMTQFGMYATMTPRNDASPSRGQWDLSDAYRYISEAYGGYHWDVWSGINLDVGIFMSYIGLCSYYNFENWIYQMSYVSSNTPWFFNGVRLQTFPSDKLKLEYWLINGWQSYGMFNEQPGIGMEVLYRPSQDWSFVSNEYWGADTLNTPGRQRFHDDTSLQYKYKDTPKDFISKGAFSLTGDIGCESGGGVSCAGGSPSAPSQYFLGVMAYNRFWFEKDKYAFTFGGGAINNPGRYLVLTPPIQISSGATGGATASTGAAPYFTQNPGDQFHAWDSSIGFDYMPNENLTFRIEAIHRVADTPYFSGPNGISYSDGTNNNPNGTATINPDLSTSETRINAAMMVRL